MTENTKEIDYKEFYNKVSVLIDKFSSPPILGAIDFGICNVIHKPTIKKTTRRIKRI